MVLRECDRDGCCYPAARGFGSCMLCSKHWCFKHAEFEDHQCPSEESDPDVYFAAYTVAKKSHLSALLDKINIEALRPVASDARNGVKCWIPAFDANNDPAFRVDLASEQSGGQNCHLDIEFEDGVVWIVLLSFEDPLLPPASAQRHIFLSEVATLKFLAQTSVPIPRVHSYQLEYPDNPVGTSYVLMSKLEGSPLDWNEASPQQRIKVMEQLADIFLELEKYPIWLMGSPIPSDFLDNEIKVGGFVREPWFETPERGLGHFSTLEAAYIAIINWHLQAFDGREIAKLPVDNYLSFKWRVIDWEFASFEAKDLAFSSPCMMWPVEDFYDGKPNLSDDEIEFAWIFNGRDRLDLAGLVLEGRKWQRYLFFLGGGVPSDKTELEALFQCLRKCFGDDDDNISSYEEWKEAALKLYRDDAILDSLIRDERAKA
ncbi:uncharacterized protein F4822DRAFT_430466 [Hypoxylon trugodes]|uniref:uncharacterized protein n=1 Tax=Hypoxylon trugodes TaxID=326681 RepID=UPI002197579A|nr:uncharacterized protein F4822DRAFT_430466 [Hypoxylon trugodes]KAI1387719.1 hypothetical protein F4822DRAFT_430466 [Hypoxylon trugodes]